MDIDMTDMTAESALSLGDSVFLDDDYESAIDAYAAVLSLARPQDSSLLRLRALSHRAYAFLKLDRYQEALEDAQSVLSIQDTAGLRPGELQVCHKRAGIALFQLGRYDEALAAFGAGQQLANLNHRDVKAYEEWIQRCHDQMAPVAKKPAPTPTSCATKPSPKTPPATTATAATRSPPRPAVSTAASRPPTMPKYQYYQNDTVMTVAILEHNVQRQDLRVDFEPKRLTIVLTKTGKDFTVVCGTLHGEIVVEKCKVVIKDEKVLIKLRKKEVGHEWHDLISKVEEPSTPMDTATDVDTKIPTVDSSKTRAYSSHRDWDAIERNLKQQEATEKPEGDAALNSLFEQIYGNADEDTRRAMIKSYQTSGGTVLSTNWNEVKEKDYEKERTAPKGMEWKNYEGERLEQQED